MSTSSLAALFFALIFCGPAQASSISAPCSKTLITVAVNPDVAACLGSGALLPILSLGDDNSIVPPINNWLTAVCSNVACSNATLSAVVQNITAGCATDLAPLGFTPDLTPTIASMIEMFYPTARKIVCLKDGSTNCIVQSLTAVQNIIGGLSVNNIIDNVFNGGFGQIPKNLSCTNCAKAAYITAQTDFPTLVSSADNTTASVTAQCGASFLEGPIPSSISTVNVDVAAASSSNAAALGSVSMISSSTLKRMAISSFVVVATACTFLV